MARGGGIPRGAARLGVLVTWAAIVRLFIIGHDACHQAFTSSARLNHAVGRIAFWPT